MANPTIGNIIPLIPCLGVTHAAMPPLRMSF